MTTDDTPRCPKCGWRLIPEDGPSGVCLPCQDRRPRMPRAPAQARPDQATPTTAQRRHIAGQCLTCGQAAATGRTRCAPCLEKQRAYAARQVAQRATEAAEETSRAAQWAIQNDRLRQAGAIWCGDCLEMHRPPRCSGEE